MILRPFPFLIFPGLAFAQANPSAPKPTELDSIVVVASRAAEPLSQVVSSVAQVERADLDRYLVHDLEGLTRYVPGISVPREGHRFGSDGFAIRGLEGNRVRILVDGIALADGYRIGQFASAGRDMVDLEMLERVEVLRGPASTLYGSDALAGVVAFRTREPADVLAFASGQHAFSARTAWDGIDDSHLLAAHWAGTSTSERWQSLVAVGQRKGHEADNRAWRAVDAANPVDYQRDSALAKLVRDTGAAGHYTLTFDASRQQRQTAVNSLRFGSGRYSTTYRLDGDDRDRRHRLSLAGNWKPGLTWLENLDAQLFRQDTSVQQESDQYRLPDRATPFESLRWRRFDFDAKATGLSLLGQARHEGARFSHWHVFGIDLVNQRYEGLRDGLETNLETGISQSTVLGEPLPVRDFPNSDTRSRALFWQEEMGLGKHLALIPGLRAEWYRLRPKPDPIFEEDFPTANPVNVDEREVTPRLALRWSLGRGHSLFAQYARGFRAAPFGDVNIGLILPVYNYEVRANPDLQPESSHGLELGWRHVGENLRSSVSVYDNRYRNLIESRANLGIDPASKRLVFQSVNRDRARIRGVEADLLWNLAGASSSLDNWQLRGALAWSQGDDLRRAVPLNTIDPARLTVGLRFDADSSLWGAELATVAVRGKTRIDHGATELFAPPGYARFDVYAWFEPWHGARINVGLFNLGNRRYWEWAAVRGLEADVRNLGANDESIGFYTSPGRNVSASLHLDW